MKAKNNYILRINYKLNCPKASPKICWSILNRFLYNKKIPEISPFLVNAKFVSDFSTEANLFTDFFAFICTSISNESTVPPSAYKTNIGINSFSINHNDILLIIENLYLNKAHGFDKISIKIIQISGESITLPLKFETI